MYQGQIKHKLLFITWDGPQTSYMEGLFMPIFEKVSTLIGVEFHVLQFTWATPEKTSKIAALAQKMGIHYNTYPVKRRPHPMIGSVITILRGKAFVENYIKQNQIDIVMPRSTLPAIMLNMIKDKNFALVFDADGLPLEERVEFGNLSTGSKQYKFLKNQETKILQAAQSVITRSQKAIDIHVKKIGEEFRYKFKVVLNGRDETAFMPDAALRDKTRAKMGLLPTEKVFLYCGSLGNQYGWNEMLAIFDNYAQTKPAKWVIITGDVNYAMERIPGHLKDKISVFTSSIHDVPTYLNVADVAFAIRKPSVSMQGVSPIKLGEYLLMGVPTIASSQIGDTDNILKEIPGCFIFHDNQTSNFKEVAAWLDNERPANSALIRQKALQFFSLQAAAESYLTVLNTIIN